MSAQILRPMFGVPTTDQVAEFAKRPEKRKRSPRIDNRAWQKASEEAKAMMIGGDWTGATPRHFVAAYEYMHERVYGVAPAELNAKERMVSAGCAKTMLDKEFDGDATAMAAFLRWTWQREKGREEWRRANGRDGQRIGPRLQFHGGLLSDYRLALHRAKTLRK
jgi:hypothetical protein